MLTNRRSCLQSIGTGFGWLAFSGLTGLSTIKAASAEVGNVREGNIRRPHHSPRAKRIIFLCMQGGPSHLDTFDPKPLLNRDHDKPSKGRNSGAKLQGSPFAFAHHGQSGLQISELFPHLAQRADELCVIRSMKTDIPNHPQAMIQLHTGSPRFVRPSMGAWVLYGLGSENQNVPGFVTINPPGQIGAQTYGSAFLPASCQGTRVGTSGSMSQMKNSYLAPKQQRDQLDFIQNLNKGFHKTTQQHPEIEGAIHSLELAFRMQAEMPEVLNLERESTATKRLYGLEEGRGDSFARQCLLARRMVEAGVRFVELNHGGWDQHQNLTADLRRNAVAIDRPIAALLMDLRERGLLDETIVMWGGEFGRTPDTRRTDGRDHNAKGFSFWLAGGGVKGGFSYGATDDYGFESVQNPVHIHDLHATMLHLLGLDHERLTFRYAGRNHRLTDVKGQVVRGLLDSVS